eukprot:CAMPEP_0118988742 /NCGR_PEP_ID=MMETSP1173-20130426/46770_1 /TAXON_ID=1034831 /ORGANISM="Rhizochromulina marina cf, Strain CCMP1243" /LENGTH=50 /DNA_ID=CAMNT_0006939689 /DNA_START=1 /DNA_END=150 /DNA_ORIENTATION=-
MAFRSPPPWSLVDTRHSSAHTTRFFAGQQAPLERFAALEGAAVPSAADRQ